MKRRQRNFKQILNSQADIHRFFALHLRSPPRSVLSRISSTMTFPLSLSSRTRVPPTMITFRTDADVAHDRSSDRSIAAERCATSHRDLMALELRGKERERETLGRSLFQRQWTTVIRGRAYLVGTSGSSCRRPTTRGHIPTRKHAAYYVLEELSRWCNECCHLLHASFSLRDSTRRKYDIFTRYGNTQ